MVGNKKNMAQIAHDLIDFIGDESAEQFVEWLSTVLPSYEAKGAAASSNDPAPAAAAPVQTPATTTTSTTTINSSTPKTTDATSNTATAAAPPKRIISLKSSSSNADKKLVSLSSSRGTVRTLNRSSDTTAADVLAKRSQRFGAVEKSPPRKKPAREDPPSGLASKRKATTEPESAATPAQTQPRRASGGRLSQLLGPPVNVDQAELDARDSLNTNKRKKVTPRESERDRSAGRSNGRSDRSAQNAATDGDSSRSAGARRSDARDQPKRPGDAPPLPPNDQPDKFNGPRGRGPQHGPPGGYFNGPPGYGGFPPPVRLCMRVRVVSESHATNVSTLLCVSCLLL